MPRYDFRCGLCKEVTEAVQGYDVTVYPCATCGEPAKRVAVYADQTIRGDTVAKPNLGNSSIDRNGRLDMGLVTEAQHEMVHDCDEAGVEPPDLYGRAKARAARGG